MPRILNYASPTAARQRPAEFTAWMAKFFAATSMLALLAVFLAAWIAGRQYPSNSEAAAFTMLPYFFIGVPLAMITGLLALMFGVMAIRRGTYVSFVGIAATIGGLIFLRTW